MNFPFRSRTKPTIDKFERADLAALLMGFECHRA